MPRRKGRIVSGKTKKQREAEKKKKRDKYHSSKVEKLESSLAHDSTFQFQTLRKLIPLWRVVVNMILLWQKN